ncbi:MAG: phosphotransferase enzyme family protein [Ilumatobacteraceae bacterium]
MSASAGAARERESLLAERLCAEHRLGTPRLVRRGSTAVFEAGDAVVKVGTLGAWASSSAALARLLGVNGIRVPAVVAAVDDPDSGLSAVALERVEASGPVDWSAVGDLVARTHRLGIDRFAGVCRLPACGEFSHWHFREMLGGVVDLLDDGEREALSAAVESVAEWADQAAAAPQVVCHGDVHPGNVIASVGVMWLVDWDMICTAPAAWDHAALLTWEQRWGGDRGMYAAFAEGYGADLDGDDLAGTLARGRLLAATLMRVRAGRTDAMAAEEARRRLRYWLGDPDAPPWRAM